MKVGKLFTEDKGNGVLLFALMLVILIATFFVIEIDYTKVLLTKVSLSMVADIAASEAAKELNMEQAILSGDTQLDSERAKLMAVHYIEQNNDLIPNGVDEFKIDIIGPRVEILISSKIPLSNYNQSAVVKARGSAWIHSLK